MNHQLFLLIH